MSILMGKKNQVKITFWFRDSKFFQEPDVPKMSYMLGKQSKNRNSKEEQEDK